MSATRRYSRNIRIYLEVLILIATTITLALTIPYAIQLWNSDPSFSVSTKSRASLIPLYGIPPLLTFLISLLNICIYIYSSQPFIYGIFIASFTSAGWLVTILLWGHCSTGSSEEDWIKWNPNICYQRNVSGYEVGVLGICGVVGGAVVLLCCLCSLYSAGLDFCYFNRGSLEVGGGLEVVTGDMEKTLRMRYSGSVSDMEIEMEAEETRKLRVKKDLKQVTENMEKRLRMRYGENGIVEVENDAHERGMLRR